MKRLQQITQQIVDGTLHGLRCESRARTVNCLIVEDDENDAILMMEAVGSVGGVTAIIARSGDEADNLLRQAESGLRPPFDIVFVDLTLRGSTTQGCDVVRNISRNFPRTHTVVVSGTMTSADISALENCYVGYISKPLEAENLEEILKKHRFRSHDPAI